MHSLPGPMQRQAKKDVGNAELVFAGAPARRQEKDHDAKSSNGHCSYTTAVLMIVNCHIPVQQVLDKHACHYDRLKGNSCERRRVALSIAKDFQTRLLCGT